MNSCEYRPVGEKQTKQRRVVCVCALSAVCTSAYLINDVTETWRDGTAGERLERQTVLPNVRASDQALKEELLTLNSPLSDLPNESDLMTVAATTISLNGR